MSLHLRDTQKKAAKTRKREVHTVDALTLGSAGFALAQLFWQETGVATSAHRMGICTHIHTHVFLY